MGLRFEPMTLSSEDLRILRIKQTEQSPISQFSDEMHRLVGDFRSLAR
jgi:hypothetical protein